MIESGNTIFKKCGTFYLETVENGRPRVRPFGAIIEYEGKVEISGTLGGEWIRVKGELVRDESRDVKVKMLEEYPTLKQMYNPNDSIMEVLYLKKAKLDREASL